MSQQDAERNAVRNLGDQIGYGHMMRLAQSLWRETLQKEWDLAGGEFIVGPCVSMTVPCVCVDSGDLPHECDYCCGSRWLTKGVKVLCWTSHE
jgi:hypothetical protein